jgi:ABC-type nitrate/sulfonate/bicarbonate transport system substrate-binding protein
MDRIVVKSAARSRHSNNDKSLRLGFVPLIDAAPLIVAHEMGFFEEEGLSVQLERQIGWANVRDKLTFGHLDASHSLLGMPLASRLGRDWFAEPLLAVMSLGGGGNAISISSQLSDAGINSAATLAKWVHDRHSARQLVFAHVFNYSMHHYLLREWLAAAGINPDLDVQLVTIPPSQVAEHMSRHYLDGYCVGEPWNMLALKRGFGTVIAATVDILPNHPEKVLAVTESWAAAHPAELRSMVKAILKACVYCNHPAHVRKLAEVLSRSHSINAPADILEASLAADRSFAVNAKYRSSRTEDWQVRSFAAEHTFPSATHCVWMMEQMVRWGHLSQDIDALAVAAQCTDTTAWREAAASLGFAIPADDFPPMPLRNGQVFEARPLPVLPIRDGISRQPTAASA